MAQPEVKIYGMILSPFVRIVLDFLRVNNIQYQFELVDLSKGQHKSPEYLAINPAGKVPALVEGDFKLGDSAAIIQYLAETRGVANNWWPQDVKERGKMMAYIHMHSTSIGGKIFTYFFKAVGGPKVFGLTFPEEEVKAARDECVSTIQRLNQMLATGKCIAGTNEPSAADLVCFSTLQQLVVMGQHDLSPYPALKQWFNRLVAIRGIGSVHEEFGKALQSMSRV